MRVGAYTRAVSLDHVPAFSGEHRTAPFSSGDPTGVFLSPIAGLLALVIREICTILFSPSVSFPLDSRPLVFTSLI